MKIRLLLVTSVALLAAAEVGRASGLPSNRSASAPVAPLCLNENHPLAYGFEWPWNNNGGGNLQNQVNNLNRMLGHVRWQFTRYHSNRAVQQDYWRVKHEADRLNALYKTGQYDQKKMRNDIQGLRVRLQEIEVRLKVKKSDLYIWK